MVTSYCSAHNLSLDVRTDATSVLYMAVDHCIIDNCYVLSPLGPDYLLTIVCVS